MCQQQALLLGNALDLSVVNDELFILQLLRFLCLLFSVLPAGFLVSEMQYWRRDISLQSPDELFSAAYKTVT